MTLREVEQLRPMTEAAEASGAYFDVKFACELAKISGRYETDILGIIRLQVEQFIADGRHKGLRNREGRCTQDACNSIICAASSQLSGDSVSKYDAADVISRWNISWSYGALIARRKAQ